MKKVLIVTYYWPPAGGISVHRCLKFAKYLRKYGWEPVIYTAKDAQYPYFDKGNEKDIPENITILQKPIIEPFNLFKFLSGRKKEESLNSIVQVRSRKFSFIDNLGIWIRGNFFIPDARALWIKPSVRFLTTYLNKNPVDAILSDGPPHTNTAIACRVKKKTGIPFLADFQDPWTQADYYQMMRITSWGHHRHSKMEQEVFRHADKITIASPTWKENLESIGANNVNVIYWGYDEDDFKGIKKLMDREFTITHTGLLGYDRLPDELFEVLAEIGKAVPEFKKMLKVQLIGQVDFTGINHLEKLGLKENLIHPGIISRSQALEKAVSSQVLLLLLNKASNAKGRIPGKLFEYLRTKRPILCLGPEGSDVEKILEKTGNGKSFLYEDKEGLRRHITELFEKFQQNQIPDIESDISSFSVEKQTAKLASYLDIISQ